MSPFSLFELPWLLCEAQLRALRVLALLNTVNYSTVVDQSDYSIRNILCNNNTFMSIGKSSTKKSWKACSDNYYYSVVYRLVAMDHSYA